jgi:hypothetical protein
MSYEDRARIRVLGLMTYLDLRDRGIEHDEAARQACGLHGHDFVGRGCDRCGAPRGI